MAICQLWVEMSLKISSRKYIVIFLEISNQYRPSNNSVINYIFTHILKA